MTRLATLAVGRIGVHAGADGQVIGVDHDFHDSSDRVVAECADVRRIGERNELRRIGAKAIDEAGGAGLERFDHDPGPPLGDPCGAVADGPEPGLVQVRVAVEAHLHVPGGRIHHRCRADGRHVATAFECPHNGEQMAGQRTDRHAWEDAGLLPTGGDGRVCDHA